MAIGDPLVNPLPTPGVTTDWGTALNLFLNEVKTAVETDVPTGGLNINADLDFNEFNATDLAASRYTDRSAGLTGGTDTRKVYTVAGDLYFTDSAQNAIRLTASGSLNAAALSGITGAGYGAAGVEVNWSSANTEYRLKSGSGTDDFAHVQCNQLRLNDGSAHYFALDTPSLAANVTWTFPNANPASTQILQVSSSGTITASNTISQDLTLSGTLKHASRTMWVAASAFNPNDGLTVSQMDTIAWQKVASDANLDSFTAALPLLVGDRVLQLKIHVRSNGTTANKNLSLGYSDMAYAGATPDGSIVVVSSDSWATAHNYTLRTIASINHTVVDERAYWLQVALTNVGDAFDGVEVTYDHP